MVRSGPNENTHLQTGDDRTNRQLDFRVLIKSFFHYHMLFDFIINLKDCSNQQRGWDENPNITWTVNVLFLNLQVS